MISDCEKCWQSLCECGWELKETTIIFATEKDISKGLSLSTAFDVNFTFEGLCYTFTVKNNFAADMANFIKKIAEEMVYQKAAFFAIQFKMLSDDIKTFYFEGE